MRNFKLHMTAFSQRFHDSEDSHDRLYKDQPNSDHYYQAICSHLEILLNARRKYLIYPNHCNELKRSLVNYGMVDFMHTYYGSEYTHREFCQEIKYLIECFESRLKNVRIELVPDENKQQILCLRICAEVTTSTGSSTAIFESKFELLHPHFLFMR